MNIWVAKVKFQPDEVIRWQANANRVTGRSTAGGRLFVTDRRILFQPNRIDSMIGRKLWECSRDAVTGIDSVGRGTSGVMAGALRERLEVETVDGNEIFVVNKLAKKIAELREIVH